jgi:hypothetical protein
MMSNDIEWSYRLQVLLRITNEPSLAEHINVLLAISSCLAYNRWLISAATWQILAWAKYLEAEAVREARQAGGYRAA